MSYKDAEKKYKKIKTLTDAIDLGNVYDPRSDSINDSDKRFIELWGQKKNLIPIPSMNGSYIITNALDRKQQIEMLLHILLDQLKEQNMTNLHGHNDTDKMIDMMKDIWLNSNNYIDNNMNGNINEHIDKSLILSKIRWITLGYQYNWTSRTYDKEEYVPFPDKIAKLCIELTESIYNISKFTLKPEAAIVNFYQEGTIMGGHKDDVESTYDHPVLSISIGCPVIFLLGGLTREEDPLPIILRSGDVLFMGGESRLRYHGVPRVFIDEGPPIFLQPISLSDNNNIHFFHCSCFLSIDDNTNNNNNTSNNTYDNTNSNDTYNDSNGIDDNHSPRKKIKRNDNNNHNDNNSSCNICGNIPTIEIIRALKFLRTTRVNINVRQVYP